MSIRNPVKCQHCGESTEEAFARKYISSNHYCEWCAAHEGADGVDTLYVGECCERYVLEMTIEHHPELIIQLAEWLGEVGE